jgi:hypothetical protein
MFSWKYDMADMTGMDENGCSKQDFQDMQDTLVMRKRVEKSEFLDINIETYIRLGSVLFTDENPASADTSIWISVRCQEFVLLCYTEYLSP